MADCDVFVIGGGPGGYVAALRAAQLGLRTVLAEREHLGGICLNWGCIPTKSLLHTADTLRRLRHAADLGLQVAEPGVDFGRVMQRSREVALRLRRGVTGLLRKAGVQVLQGQARLLPDRTVEIRGADGTSTTQRSRHVVLATGARPRALPQLPFDGARVWSYREALAATSLPRSLLVVGAGAIGMEFASFYATLGTQVTVVEAQPRVLPGGDADVSAFVARAFRHDGIAVHTGARVEQARTGGDGVQLVLGSATGPLTLEAEHVLVAIGLAGNTADLGLEHTQVRVQDGRILADAHGATADPAVHAVGDVTGAPMLAHRASHQGMACVERIAGLPRHGESLIPSCVYSHPPSAAIGLTEEQAHALGRPVRIGRFPLEASGKALAIGEASGFVKTLFDADSGALLGAHIVGAEAPELIHGLAIAASAESTEEELIATVFPHPTLSEALHESVLAAWDRALHIERRPRAPTGDAR